MAQATCSPIDVIDSLADFVATHHIDDDLAEAMFRWTFANMDMMQESTTTTWDDVLTHAYQEIR